MASQLLSSISQDVPDELVFILKVTHSTRNNSCAEVRFPAWIIIIPVWCCILLAWLFPVLCVTFHVLLPAFVCFLNLYAPQLFCSINCVFSSRASCLFSCTLIDFCFVAWVLTFPFLFLILYFCIRFSFTKTHFCLPAFVSPSGSLQVCYSDSLGWLQSPIIRLKNSRSLWFSYNY